MLTAKSKNKAIFSVHGTAGFSLLEVMIVLALLTGVTLLSVPLLQKRTTPPAPAVVTFLRTQQAASIDKGRRNVLMIKDDQLSASLTGHQMTWTGESSPDQLLTFYGDGTATAATFRLTDTTTGAINEAIVTVTVNPFDGQIQWQRQHAAHPYPAAQRGN